MKKLYALSIILIAALTIAVRLYRVDQPVADWHSFRQTDTASVAQLYVANGVDLLHPRYQDLSNIQSGKDNPNGWRMVEFPLYQGIAATLARRIPSVSVDVWLRIVTILSATGTVIILMALTGAVSSPMVAVFTGFTYALLPYSVFYGRTILPETFAVFWAMLSVYLVYLATKVSQSETPLRGRNWYFMIAGAFAGALAVLVKPTAGFLLVPVLYLLYRRYGFSLVLLIRLLAYSLICLLPLWWWRVWITQFPEGIPVFDWLLNKGNIRFKGAWFQWLFAKRLAELILGYWGLIPFGLGVLVRLTKKEGWLFPVMGAGGLLYLTVFAAGNVQHDYYQILLIPIVSIYVAKGLAFLLTEKLFHPFARYSLFVVSLLFMLAFSWYTMRTYYWINRPEIIEAGLAADAMLPKAAKVIAPYNGDTTFLYQTKRQGWPLGFDIDEKIAMGATHYVTVSPTDNDWETKTLAEQYTVLVRNEKYAIIDLTNPNHP
ncbi:MAG: phospholipid carrier-dependent glycosyltransferase [Patescibacteria group bacterium]